MVRSCARRLDIFNLSILTVMSLFKIFAMLSCLPVSKFLRTQLLKFSVDDLEMF